MGSKTENDDVTSRTLVLETCRAVASDADAPANARIAAARLLAELLGIAGRLQAGAIDAGEGAYSEMSAEDLDREIARLSRKG